MALIALPCRSQQERLRQLDKVQGEVKAVYIEGTVSLSEVMEVEVVSP